ncbi:hypothetical protein BRD01_03540 [Halobacteriales archaeon QS_8_65_32]|nr:MAG: hypothetical protein BRD01_03540 [Halobacteriales archaeon QS_8_65_32]
MPPGRIRPELTALAIAVRRRSETETAPFGESGASVERISARITGEPKNQRRRVEGSESNDNRSRATAGIGRGSVEVDRVG